MFLKMHFIKLKNGFVQVKPFILYIYIYIYKQKYKKVFFFFDIPWQFIIINIILAETIINSLKVLILEVIGKICNTWIKKLHKFIIIIIILTQLPQTDKKKNSNSSTSKMTVRTVLPDWGFF